LFQTFLLPYSITWCHNISHCLLFLLVTLFLHPNKHQSDIVHFLLQFHSPTSHAEIAVLPFRTLPSISKHIIWCQYFIICPLHCPFLLSLPSSVSANQLATQIGIPFNFLENLPWTLSNSVYASPNPHTSIPYIMFDSHVIQHIFSSI
jgi:hypothetical protein